MLMLSWWVLNTGEINAFFCRRLFIRQILGELWPEVSWPSTRTSLVLYLLTEETREESSVYVQVYMRLLVELCKSYNTFQMDGGLLTLHACCTGDICVRKPQLRMLLLPYTALLQGTVLCVLHRLPKMWCVARVRKLPAAWRNPAWPLRRTGGFSLLQFENRGPQIHETTAS